MTGTAPDAGGDMVVDREAAAAQLAALRADRAALADRVVQPWWYDVCLGLLLFGFLAYALDSPWVTFPALVVFGAGLGALVAVYRRITGVGWDARKVGPVQDRAQRAVRWWVTRIYAAGLRADR